MDLRFLSGFRSNRCNKAYDRDGWLPALAHRDTAGGGAAHRARVAHRVPRAPPEDWHVSRCANACCTLAGSLRVQSASHPLRRPDLQSRSAVSFCSRAWLVLVDFVLRPLATHAELILAAISAIVYCSSRAPVPVSIHRYSTMRCVTLFSGREGALAGQRPREGAQGDGLPGLRAPVCALLQLFYYSNE